MGLVEKCVFNLKSLRMMADLISDVVQGVLDGDKLEGDSEKFYSGFG